MIEQRLIEEVTEIFNEKTVVVSKVLLVEHNDSTTRLTPSNNWDIIKDLVPKSLIAQKKYPPYISINAKNAYVFFNIRCSKTGTYVVRFGRTLRITGWVNDNYVFCGNSDNQKDIKIMNLNQGDNFFFLELSCTAASEGLIDFTARIELYENLIEMSEWDLVEDYFENKVLKNITLYKCRVGENMNLSVIPIDYTQKISWIEIKFTTFNNEETKKNVKLYEVFTINLNNFANDHDLIGVTVKYIINDDIYYYKDVIITNCNFNKMLTIKENWLKEICNDKKEFEEQRIGYKKIYAPQISLLEDRDYTDFLYREILESKILHTQVSASDYINAIKGIGGFYPVSFKSELDGSHYTYTIFLPDEYDDSLEYPLVVVFPYFDERNDLLSTMFHNIRKDKTIEKAIYIQVNTLGQTMGSYIGDRAVVDCITHVTKFFSVNKNRIYGLGYSLGSYSCFTIAQNYPDLFAALYVCSGEYIDEMMENIKHIHIVYVSSAFDQNFAQNKFDSLRHNESFQKVIYYYTQFDYHRTLSLYFTHISKKIFKELLSSTQEIPQEFSLKTQRIKYGKAFGVELLSPIDYKKTMSLFYRINGSKIEFTTENVRKFRFKIPQNLIANTVLWCNKEMQILENKDVVYEKNTSLVISRNYNDSTDNINCVLHHNLGMLYIFMQPMKIAYSENSDVVISLAKKFQSPTLFMQNEPQINVSYPICYSESLDALLKENKNIVVIQCGEKAPLLEQMRQYFDIDFDQVGCRYKGSYLQGEYSIIRMFQHPCNDMYRILLVYTNNESQFKKNIYLRRVSIPSYIYGLHPQNSETIICFNNKYYLL